MSHAHSCPQRFAGDIAVQLVEAGCTGLGRMPTRSAAAIGASPWSIGCETLDRDFADFAHSGPLLGELGATQARVQAGWAKTDRGDGRFDFAWLDAIVDGCLAQGVRPWLELSYGNPAYPGGGGIGLSEGWPRTPEALRAWDRWVTAVVQRYRDRVSTWEIWNEPENHTASGPADYAVFFAHTARRVRGGDPAARIVGLALGGRVDYAAAVLTILSTTGDAGLLDELSYHYYPHNPDDRFDEVAELAERLRRHAPHASLRQGETGAPSETIAFLALGEYDWSERKQAVWNLRRLLAHHVRGIPMNLFQLSDMHYGGGKGLYTGRNPKGLLCTGPDHRVRYRKPSYAAAQHVFTLLDHRFPLRPLAALPVSGSRAPCSAYAWTVQGTSRPGMVSWWNTGRPPSLAGEPLARCALPPQPLTDPLLLDLL
ncbi:MAG: GH39 family glycosyl hydrolase, partial [Planctomycetota bacterium]